MKLYNYEVIFHTTDKTTIKVHAYKEPQNRIEFEERVTSRPFATFFDFLQKKIVVINMQYVRDITIEEIKNIDTGIGDGLINSLESVFRRRGHHPLEAVRLASEAIDELESWYEERMEEKDDET